MLSGILATFLMVGLMTSHYDYGGVVVVATIGLAATRKNEARVWANRGIGQKKVTGRWYLPYHRRRRQRASYDRRHV